VRPARKVEAKKLYETPVLRRLNLQEAKAMLCSQIKSIFRTSRAHPPEPIALNAKNLRAKKKGYTRPMLNKLTSEQAKLLLIGRASIGDESAYDFLYSFFHDAKSDPGHSA